MKKTIFIFSVVAILFIAIALIIKPILSDRINKKIIEDRIASQFKGETNGTPNAQLIEMAKQYVLSKPRLLWWDRKKYIDWNDKLTANIFSQASPEWIVSQEVYVHYNGPNQYQYDDFKNLNEKYVVHWFFIPGCKENPNSNNEPNWFGPSGLPCLGGYDMDVILNSNKTIDHAELNAYN
jgi:hypothetical protein